MLATPGPARAKERASRHLGHWLTRVASPSLNPSPSYYDQFQGYTLGLFVAVATSFALFLLGSRVLAPVSLRKMPQAERDERLQRFKSNCLSRVLLLLYLTYPVRWAGSSAALQVVR